MKRAQKSAPSYGFAVGSTLFQTSRARPWPSMARSECAHRLKVWVELMAWAADQPVDGLDSQDSAWGADSCWG